MKIFYSESKPDYDTYTFNYGIYCLMEDLAECDEIYSRGFLPYSGNTELMHSIFYLARSLRVDIDRFADTSENRRVNRKIEHLEIQLNCLTKNEVLHSDTKFHHFASTYVQERIGDQMPISRLDYILTRPVGTHVFKFSQGENPVGYVLAYLSKKALHYWFSFFDTELMKSHALGKWMMWKIIKWAQEHNLDHVYLGTSYGTKSLYKIRDHKGLEFFDGSGWNTDTNQLKSWCKKDGEVHWGDRLKAAEDMNAYLEKITGHNS